MAKKEDDSLEGLLTGIRKEHGAGSIMLLGETPLEPVEVIPTGSFTLDEALRVGGFGRGRIIEIYGPESSGKTSIALHAVGNAQKQGLLAAFIDAEHAIDPEWAAVLGVDTDKLLVSQPDHGEQALSITEKLCRSGKVGIIVVDSVAALVPRAEIEGEMGDSHMGLHARLMSQALRKITGVASDSKTTVIFINQLRDKIGVMFGSPETTTGGKALKFYASVRLDVRKVEILKEGTVPVGHRVRVKVVKNKLGPPFGSAEFDFLTGEGISREAEVLDLGVERGVIGKGGSWFTFEGSNLGNGKLAAVRSMKADPERASRISAAVSAAAGAKVKPAKNAAALDMSGEAPWEAEETGV